MPLYVGDYLADTGHLTTVQHGAYILLIMNYWTRGKLPGDDRQLAAITKLSLRDWRRHKPVLAAFFGESWQHRRLDAELIRAVDKRDKRAVAGSRGGTTSAIRRWQKKR
jgi:uncharacterized protein YdaU (DUF1376 family)